MKPHNTISGLLLFILFCIGIFGYNQEPWLYMWALTIGLFYNCKWLSLVHHPNIHADIKYRKTYLFLWIGMDPTPFREESKKEFKWNSKYLLSGVLNIMLGVGLIFTTTYLHEHQWLLKGWVACTGIIFVLHFGVLKLNTWFLRNLGFDVQPIMKLPVATQKISEFWGGRWNKAFNQLVYPFVYTPIKKKLSHKAAILFTFLVSGLVHELVISLPAKSGWGLPTIYFLVQALGMNTERNQVFRKLPLFIKYVFTFLIIAGPVILLFHPPFMKTVILPFIQTLGVGA